MTSGKDKMIKQQLISELTETSVSKNPFEQFRLWFDEAEKSGIREANAMVLATVGNDRIPSARTVLLKDFNENGFVFYTNYESEKGREISENPNVSLLFFWKELLRQVRITGIAGKISREESRVYFHIRPVESQLGAMASRQSNIIPDRNHLMEEYERVKQMYKGKEIPLPSFWGGYRVVPRDFEFWQSRENRLHDRICYTKTGKKWIIFRRSP